MALRLLVLLRSFALGVALVLLASWIAPAVARAAGPASAGAPPTHQALYSDGPTGRYLLGGTWLYRSDPGDAGIAGGWWRPSAATGGWIATAVPESFNTGNFTPAGMTGSVGWYRRDFTLPAGAFPAYVRGAARRWVIRFESVNYRATVWLNGRRLGAHLGVNLPFEFDLSRLRRGINRLVVRVDNRALPGELPPGPGGGWWNYGGILREVYLRSVAGADLSQVRVRPRLPCPRCAATVEVQAQVRNLTGAPEKVRLTGSLGRQPIQFGTATIPPGSTWTAVAAVTISHPRLWAPGHPALYRVSVTLSDQTGRKLAGYQTQTGIRRIEVTSGGQLALNGRVLHLRGVEIREQDLRRGGALDPGQIRRLIDWVRALGADVIRSDAPNPELAELADRYGLLMWLDVPVNGAVTDTYLRMAAWRDQARSMLEDNILTNQNHPSVLAWSIGNELPTPATGPEAVYIARTVALVHRLDPTRPAAMSISDWPGNPCQPAYAPLDAIGVNEYFGWYDAGGGTTDDRDALGPYLDGLRRCYPHQGLFITEFGFDGNRAGPADERGTYQFQAGAAAYHLSVFNSKPWLSGAMYFVLQDSVQFPGYAAGNPWPSPPFNYHGLVDFEGRPKPAWPVVSSIYHHTVQVAPGGSAG